MYVNAKALLVTFNFAKHAGSSLCASLYINTDLAATDDKFSESSIYTIQEFYLLSQNILTYSLHNAVTKKINLQI